MIRTERRMRLCLALLAALLIFIWGNSLMPAEISQAFSDWVKALLFGGGSGDGAGGGSGLLRKVAHFMEFAALGMCLCWLFGMLGRGTAAPFLWGVAAACVDESLQFLAPGRAPRLLDVGIDSCGVLTGIVCLSVGYHYWKKRSTI